MRKLLLIFMSLIFTSLVCQDKGSNELIFTIDGNQPIINGEQTSLKLPLFLLFENTEGGSFEGKKIEFIIEDGNEEITIVTNTFGEDALTLMEENEKEFYAIQINKQGAVNPSKEGDGKIEVKNFKIKIGEAKAIELKLKTKNIISESRLSISKYQAGNIYYDATELSKVNENQYHILDAYGLNYDNIDNNKYLDEFFDIPRGEAQGLQTLISNIGNTDVTNFAAGLARFLAERTKDELNEAFFNKMRDEIAAYPELKTVFPQTSEFLNLIDTYSYASVIQVLKEAFETDIQNLPENLYGIKELRVEDCNTDYLKDKRSYKKLTDCEQRMKNLKSYFKSREGQWVGLGMYTVKEVAESTNPAELLNSFATSEELMELLKFANDSNYINDVNVASSIRLGNFISESLRSKDDNQVWVTLSQFKELFKDERTTKIYLGLLLAKEQMNAKDKKIGPIVFKNSGKEEISLEFILDTNYSKYNSLSDLIKDIYTAYNSTNNAVKKIIKSEDNSTKLDPHALYDYYRNFTASVKPIAHNKLLNQMIDSSGKVDFDLGRRYDKIAGYLNPSVDIVYHITTEKYSAAIYDATVLMNAISDSDKSFARVSKSFVKYGTMISTVANAQTSEEVEKAIEASVLPVGSSAIKRNSNWSISLNAYVGVFAGKAKTDFWEYKTDTAGINYDSINVKNVTTYGLYAPIGISFNKGIRGGGGGFTIGLQILDVGALVNFYLTNSNETAMPDDFVIRLSNIFAPGAFAGYNIPKTPLTITGGFQYIPALYKTEQIESNSVIEAQNAWRLSIGLVVDIPMINFKVWDFRK